MPSFCPVCRLRNPYILRFLFVKIPQFVILLGCSLFYWVFRYTTDFAENMAAYLVYLATRNIPGAELTSHPHLGGDDNANLFRFTEAMCRGAMPLIPVIRKTERCWISCSAHTKIPTKLIRRKSRTASKNWTPTYGSFRWMTTMRSGIYAAAFVRPTNAKPFLTASTWTMNWNELHTKSLTPGIWPGARLLHIGR